MNITKKQKIVAGVLVGLLILFGIIIKAYAATPADYGLTEGDVVRAQGDLDIYIVNDWGYKRLFVNPAIFNIYGHLGWSKVKEVTPVTRDAFTTSGLFRNCESDNQKVYGLVVVSEDIANLHWVNMTGAQVVAEDPNFFKKVFCINNAEQALYGVGAPLTSLSQVPNYSRAGAVSSANLAVLSPSNLAGQTLLKNASGVKLLTVDFKGNAPVNSLKVKRLGFQPADSYDEIFLYKNGIRITDPVTFSGSDNNMASFNNLGLAAPFTLDVVVNFSGAEVGSPAQVELQGDYPGLPLRSNQFLFANVSASVLTFTDSASVDDVVIGQANAKVGEFKLTAGDEGVTVKSIQLRNYGNTDVSNVRMVVDGVTYPGLYVGDDKYVFTTNFVINDGKSKKAILYADISTNADAGDVVKFRLEKSYDITAIGNVYGFGVQISGAGTYLDEVVVLSSGDLTALTTSNNSVTALWGETGIQLFQFKLKATDETFNVNELSFSVDPDIMDKLYVYRNGTLLASETVDGESTVVLDTNFNVSGTEFFTVKGDLLDQDEINSGDFVPALVGVEATGLGSDEDVSWTGSVAGKTVTVYPSVLSVTSNASSGTFTPSVAKKVFSFDLVANGGEIKLASGSPMVVLNVETVGAPTSFPWELKKGSEVVASGSYGGGQLAISLDMDVDDIVLYDGDSVSFNLYFNTVNFTGDNRYVGISMENEDGVLSWLSQDSEGEWMSTQLSSVEDGVSGLPVETVEWTE